MIESSLTLLVTPLLTRCQKLMFVALIQLEDSIDVDDSFQR
jgi:hypothetical protein